MAQIEIKNFDNRDGGYFPMLVGNTTVYFGFNYPEIHNGGEELVVYLERRAILALSGLSNKATLNKDSYFYFECGEFHFTNEAPDWAKDIYEK